MGRSFSEGRPTPPFCHVAHAKIHRARPPLLFSSLEEAMSLYPRNQCSSQENYTKSCYTSVLVSRLRLQGLSTRKTELALLTIQRKKPSFHRTFHPFEMW